MNPQHLVDRLLEGTEDGANLTKEEIQQAYLNDYNGNMGLKKVSYMGPTKSGAHEYLALIFNDVPNEPNDQWLISHIYVSKGKREDNEDKLTVDFAGSTIGEFADRDEAEDFFDKEAHVKGGGTITTPERAKPLPSWSTQASTPSGFRRQRGPRRGGGGDSPHWDGSRYAL